MRILPDKSATRQISDTQYQVQRAVAGVDQIKTALEKIELPFSIEAATANEALELLRANITSMQMLLLVISITNLKRPNS